jgi:PAS domain-containing protein
LDEAEGLAHVGSWLLDVRTRAVQWSAEFHKIHGIDPLDFRGTLEAHLELIHPEDRDSVRAAMEHSVALGRPFRREYRVLLVDQMEAIELATVPSWSFQLRRVRCDSHSSAARADYRRPPTRRRAPA